MNATKNDEEKSSTYVIWFLSALIVYVAKKFFIIMLHLDELLKTFSKIKYVE